MSISVLLDRRISHLQQHILLTTFRGGGRISREAFLRFYGGRDGMRSSPVKIITKALERLIDRGLLIGYGVRTPQKWYIKEVKLTTSGRRVVQIVLAQRQQTLPIRKQ